MKVEISRTIQHALLIGPDELSAIHSILTQHFERIEISTENQGSTKREFEDLDELLEFPNLTHRRIQSIRFIASSPNEETPYKSGESLVLSLKDNSSLPAFFSLTSHDDYKANGITSDLENHIREARPWYSMIARLDMTYTLLAIFVGPIFIYLTTVAISMAVGAIELPQPSDPKPVDLPSWIPIYLAAAIGAISVPVFFLAERLKKYLFPRVFFLIGKQAERYSLIKSIRQYILGGVLLALVLGIAANVTTSFLIG